MTPDDMNSAMLRWPEAADINGISVICCAAAGAAQVRAAASAKPDSLANLASGRG
jgi:hypothetical protein